MTAVRGLLVGLVLLGLTGLALAQDKEKPKDKDKDAPKGKNQELIQGSWAGDIPLQDMKKIKVELKFAKDGKVTLTYEGRPAEGTYKFTDDETMVVEYKQGDTSSKEEVKVKVTGKKLTLTSSKGKPQEFDRVE